MASNPGATLEVHSKLFGTGGVSLQSQELTKALRKREWRVHSCASVPREETAHCGVSVALGLDRHAHLIEDTTISGPPPGV
jgi:hypothetical protein